MPRLEGKNTLITGASSGIGRAIAIRFAREGAHVVINHYDDADQAEVTRTMADAASKEGGERDGKAIVIGADVSDEHQVKAMFQRTFDAFGSLDVLVNNAGIQKPCPSDQLEIADFDRVIAVNLRGSFLCAREALRHDPHSGALLLITPTRPPKLLDNAIVPGVI